MSMLLIDSGVLDFVATALKRCELVAPNSIDQKRCSDSLKKIEDAIQESDKRRFSVLEWHPMSEKPEDHASILVKYPSGNVYMDCALIDENGNFSLESETTNYVTEWAYLPE